MCKCIFLDENVWIPIEISLKFVPKGSINNNPALLQIMAWRRPGDKPLAEPMMFSSLTHICVTRPQGVNILRQGDTYMRQWIGSSLVQVTYAVSSYYLNQRWHFVNWTLVNKIQWNINQNDAVCFSRRCSWKCRQQSFGDFVPALVYQKKKNNIFLTFLI